MEPQAYAVLARQEDHHWWFRARRAVAWAILKRIALPKNPKILDAGCGSGGNLPMLAPLGELFAFEMHTEARTQAEARQLAPVEFGKLPNNIPFDREMFDLITLFDILEHVEDDQAALIALAGRLQRGGLLLINVPAFSWLYSKHDLSHHHFRRYDAMELRLKLHDAGFRVRLLSYWNFWLFPIAAAIRIFERSQRTPYLAFGSEAPVSWINRLLTKIASSERFIVPRLRLPFGTSIIVLAEKN